MKALRWTGAGTEGGSERNFKTRRCRSAVDLTDGRSRRPPKPWRAPSAPTAPCRSSRAGLASRADPDAACVEVDAARRTSSPNAPERIRTSDLRVRRPEVNAVSMGDSAAMRPRMQPGGVACCRRSSPFLAYERSSDRALSALRQEHARTQLTSRGPIEDHESSPEWSRHGSLAASRASITSVGEERRAPSRPRAIAAQRGRRFVPLSTARIKIRPGQRMTLKAPLSSKWRAGLRGMRRVRVRIRLTLRHRLLRTPIVIERPPRSREGCAEASAGPSWRAAWGAWLFTATGVVIDPLQRVAVQRRPAPRVASSAGRRI